VRAQLYGFSTLEVWRPDSSQSYWFNRCIKKPYGTCLGLFVGKRLCENNNAFTCGIFMNDFYINTV